MVRLQKYRIAAHEDWTRAYREWLSANLRTELAQVIIGGGVSAGTIALVAFLFWRETLPASVSLKEAVIGAILLGFVGGLATLFVRVIWISASRRLSAPFRLWSANQGMIAAKDAQIDWLAKELFDINQDEPVMPRWIECENIESPEVDLGYPLTPTQKVYHLKVLDSVLAPQSLRVVCSGWVHGVTINIELERKAVPRAHVAVRRRREKSFDFLLPQIDIEEIPAQLKIALQSVGALRIKAITDPSA